MNHKKTFLLLMTLLLAVTVAMADALDEFTSSKAINSPQASVLVIDLQTGREIMSHNADKALVPASITKCITTATLLDKVGSRFRYETPVSYTGHIRGGVLDGDVIIEASGDPSINSKYEPGSDDLAAEVASMLVMSGVRTVNGKIIIDETRFVGPAVNPTWQSADLSQAYGTGTHGFNFEDNASGTRSVADPAAVFRSRLTTALAREGIKVLGQQTEQNKRHRLGTHRSAQVDEIMRSCMMRSDNQFAEAMLRTVGSEYGGDGSTASGVEHELKYWRNRKAPLDGVNIVDGSGLSRSNRITARFMADVLTKMAENPWYASFFPLAGQEGTLKKFLAGTTLDGEIALKTGSMKGIQCYAGYKLDDNYAPTHVVVIMMNEMGNRAAARAQVEKLLLQTFK